MNILLFSEIFQMKFMKIKINEKADDILNINLYNIEK